MLFLAFLLPKLLQQGRPMAASCITGDDTGLVKRVGLSQGQELHRWGVQAAGVGVCRLSWGAGDCLLYTSPSPRDTQ